LQNIVSLNEINGDGRDGGHAVNKYVNISGTL